MQCRACRRSNCEEATNMSYVVPTDGKTLYDYFNDCTQLEATARDDLPKILCINCTKNLQQAYDFRQEALRSDVELKKGLVFAKNETTLAGDSAMDQSDLSQDTETNPPFHLLYVSPKIETAFVGDPEHTNVPQHTENATYDLLAAPTKNESLLLYESSEQGETLKDNDKAPTVDPLNMIKEEIKAELSDDMFEESNDEQFDDDKSVDNDKILNARLRKKLNRKHSFKCDICGHKSRRKNQLKNHVFEQHKDTILCKECSKVYELPVEMEMHKKLVHNTDRDTRCPWCENASPMQKDMLAKHIEKNHKCNYLKYFPRLRVLCRREDEPFQCERCPKVFPTIYELADHLQGHTFDCPMCSMSFKKFFGFRAHMKRIHHQMVSSVSFTGNRPSTMQFDCPICKIQFKLKENLQRHINNKHNESTNNSKNRSKSKDQQISVDDDSAQQAHTDDVKTSKKLEEKETINENSDLVKSKTIPASSKLREKDKRNSDTSNKEKKYICTYCPREFTSRRYAKIHEQKIHEGEKSARKSCPICKKEVDARYLNTHITSMHTAEPKLDCDICGDLFKTYALLSNHKNRKHLNRKHPCTVCNRGFITASELKVHMRAHTGEEPYACHLCERRFKIKGMLNYHLQQHAGIKRECNVCGKEFNSIVKLKTHSYTHTGMPYKCRWCDYGCVKRLKFKEHLLRMHSKTLTEEELSEIFKANTGRYSRARIETMDDAIQETDYSN